MTAVIKTDVAIIGAGPVGLFGIFECGMMGLKVDVIDALDVVGGQCAALYPEKPIYDIPAYPKILGGDLIENLKEQAAPFDPEYHLGQSVERLTKQDGLWCLETSKGKVIEAQAVIIAAGVGAFGPKRPPLDGIEGYEGTSVFYYVKKRSDFAGKRLVIAGGGDSALDWVLSLSEIAQSISVVHRRDKFRAAPESVTRMRELAEAGKIELVTPYQLEGLEGDGKNLTGVVVQDFDGNNRTLPADMLLPFYGLSTNLGPIGTWGVEIEKKNN
jgi:thioredoxin reductase (NADPH)